MGFEDLNSGSHTCPANIYPLCQLPSPQSLLLHSVSGDRCELHAWCVHVTLLAAFTCGSLRWQCCASSPQVHPPRGESSSCYSPLIVIVEGLPILGWGDREEERNPFISKFAKCDYSPGSSCFWGVYSSLITFTRYIIF